MSKIIKEKIKAKNRHWKNYIDKDYLGSHNLEDGEEMILTIAKFEGEEMVIKVGGKANEMTAKQVLYFEENVPKMIINITNGTAIATMYGAHPDGWIGKQIQVYATPVKAFGKTAPALRIRDTKPQGQIDLQEYRAKLSLAKTLEELGNAWKSLPLAIKSNKEIEAFKNDLKLSLSKPQENNGEVDPSELPENI